MQDPTNMNSAELIALVLMRAEESRAKSARIQELEEMTEPQVQSLIKLASFAADAFY